MNPWPKELFSEFCLNNTAISSDETICDRGRCLMNFMVDNDFVLINGRTKSDTPAQPTYDSHGTSIIDLIWISIDSLHLVADLEVVMEPSLFDHKPVCISVKTDHEYTAVSPGSKLPNEVSPKIKWSDKEKDSYNSFLASQVPCTILEDPEMLFNELYSTIIAAAENSNMITKRYKPQRVYSPNQSPSTTYL